MMRGPGATTLLGRALIASAALAGAPIEIAGDEEVAWCSATFTGARHAFDIRAPDCGCTDAWLDAIGQLDLPLSGHLVADLSTTRRALCDGKLNLRIEALTVALDSVA